MKVTVAQDAKMLGQLAAREAGGIIRRAIAETGRARIILSTGASQFETLACLVNEQIDWSKVEMFHLDEYVNLPQNHPASFRRYLKERFVSKVSLKKAHFVDGTAENIAELTRSLDEAPVCLGLIGIGENGHIAFNDPPADFDTQASYIVVSLDDRCRRQQVGEGWFTSLDAVPAKAVSMTCSRIMKSERIISCVPYAVKAEAVQKTLMNPKTNMVPATLLKEHPRFSLYLDQDSASRVNVQDAVNVNETLTQWDNYSARE